MTTSMVGFKNRSDTQKISPKMIIHQRYSLGTQKKKIRFQKNNKLLFGGSGREGGGLQEITSFHFLLFPR